MRREKRRARLLYLAAVAVGLAFNVKLFEALLVALPASLLYGLAAARRRCAPAASTSSSPAR